MVISGSTGASGMRVLDTVSVFKNLAPIERDKLAAQVTVFTPRDGARIFEQGQAADAVFAIVAGDGQVRIATSNRHGKTLMVELFKQGDIFGEIGVMDRGCRTAGAVVSGRVQIARIPGETFRTALATIPGVGAAVSGLMSMRLRRTFELLSDATFEPLEVRLARQLLYLARLDAIADERGVRIRSRLRQADLANLLGATQRTIITILNGWRASGLVKYGTGSAQITLCDLERMQALVAPDADVKQQLRGEV